MSIEQDSILAPATGAAFTLTRGESFTITDVEGHQVSDLVAFAGNDVRDKFSPGNTRKLNSGLLLGAGSILYSTRCTPLLRIESDTVGRHDLTSSWCNPYDYPIRFQVTEHPSCLAILTEALAPFDIAEDMIPEPFNVFMKTIIEADSGAITVVEGDSNPGDYIEFRAMTDCIVAMTVCPQDQNACNGWKITPLRVRRQGAGQTST